MSKADPRVGLLVATRIRRPESPSDPPALVISPSCCSSRQHALHLSLPSQLLRAAFATCSSRFAELRRLLSTRNMQEKDRKYSLVGYSRSALFPVRRLRLWAHSWHRNELKRALDRCSILTRMKVLSAILMFSEAKCRLSSSPTKAAMDRDYQEKMPRCYIAPSTLPLIFRLGLVSAAGSRRPMFPDPAFA